MNLREGENTLRAVAKANGNPISDEIRVSYQTKRWKSRQTGLPRTLTRQRCRHHRRRGARRSPCALPRCRESGARFGAIGDGVLLDDLGTADGSRVVQLRNGTARISLRMTGDTAVANVSSAGIATGILTIHSRKLSTDDR